jgi:hypothetical protein
LRARIKIGLAQLPLSAQEVDRVLPRLVDNHRFLLESKGGLANDSALFDYASKVKSVVQAFKAHGFTEARYLRAALKVPLFAQLPVVTTNDMLTQVNNISFNNNGVVSFYSDIGLDPLNGVGAFVYLPGEGIEQLLASNDPFLGPVPVASAKAISLVPSPTLPAVPITPCASSACRV